MRTLTAWKSRAILDRLDHALDRLASAKAAISSDPNTAIMRIDHAAVWIDQAKQMLLDVALADAAVETIDLAEERAAAAAEDAP